MSIPYNFEVVAVDQAARAMEVRYTSEGRQPMNVGTRLPYVNETLEQVISMYAPVAYWLEQEAAVQDVQVGVAGSVNTPSADTPLADIKARKKREIANARLAHEVSGLALNGGTILTDRESQAILTSAYSALKDGLVDSFDWKTADGTFVTVTLQEVTAMAHAVSNHVQTSFSTERDLVAQIDAATTSAEVAAVTWPR
jgi:hypothetical protein